MGMNCVMAIILLAQNQPPEGGPSFSWISCLTPLGVIGLIYWGVRNWNNDTSDSDECPKEEKD